MSSNIKHRISALPLPPRTSLLPAVLTPDPSSGATPGAFVKDTQARTPSVQRRARLVSPDAHFAWTAPFPTEFPYDISAPTPGERDYGDTEELPEEEKDKAGFIERWLARRESRTRKGGEEGVMGLYYPDHPSRKGQRILLGLAKSAHEESLPTLDVGDAYEMLGTSSLTQRNESYTPTPGEAADARQELVDVLSGHAILMSPEPEGKEDTDVPAWAPYSLRYSGHQFGTWAGQLGDGRAICILTTPNDKEGPGQVEVQLKGAGRTPFSRSADGLAVLRSSVREFLGSEAMNALGIPTTRALSLISLPDTRVRRERVERACVVARLAGSFLRIGSFEALNPPTNAFFFGGGQQPRSLPALWRLADYVRAHVLRLPDGGGEQWARGLVLEVARRNAEMVAGWQAYGFMHGVINTDNVSLLGLTIDYGPYAFMDVFDPLHICNHTDEGGRYAYKYQPNMIIYALRALLNSLAPSIGFQALHAASAGAAEGPKEWLEASDEQVEEWTKKGLEMCEEMESVAQSVSGEAYGRLMRARLGLRRADPDDEAKLTRPLFELMREHGLDFHGTFRVLCAFHPGFVSDASAENSEHLAAFINRVLASSQELSLGRLDAGRTRGEWEAWLKGYAARIEGEADEWAGDVGAEREKAMRGKNPRFVLRQWLLEEVIQKLEEEGEARRGMLAKVLEMSCNPFAPWGAEDDAGPEAELSAEEREERRFCGMGEGRMLGFQCSCSS